MKNRGETEELGKKNRGAFCNLQEKERERERLGCLLV